MPTDILDHLTVSGEGISRGGDKLAGFDDWLIPDICRRQYDVTIGGPMRGRL